ncbi:MAG: hypothetical protein H0T20_06090 [Actinobacteria bacterium]|nr:hypothetical protein [Actinomycetota bacterium]
MAAVAAGVLATPGLASATALSAFHTPGWAAECYVPFPHELPLSKTGITCLTPSDGFTISMGPFGRPTKTYDKNAVGYRDPFAARRLLRLGQHWAVRPYWACSSKATGLTCWNKSGHGWWLGRFRGYRVF